MMSATLSLDQKAPGMAFTTIDAPHSADASGLLDRIGARIGTVIRAMQYSRMLQAMSELSDDQLATMGLTRSDIPGHARECIYGPRT